MKRPPGKPVERAGPGRLSELKTLLETRGLSPRKSLGQNFLLDTNFATAVAREAEADAGTLLLEVGPGTGFLTRALLDAHPAARVLAVELDRGLAELLRDRFAGEIAASRLTLIEGDALAGKHGLNAEWLAEAGRIAHAEGRPRWVLCANLAYNMATPLIANLLLGPRASSPARVRQPFQADEAVEGRPAAHSSGQNGKPDVMQSSGLQAQAGGVRHTVQTGPIDAAQGKQSDLRLVQRIVATVQLELADRLVGKPASSDYGPLAVLASLCATSRIVRKVGAEVFWPRPQVHSAVLRIDLPPWSKTPFSPEEAQRYMAFLHQVFGQRRKTLRAILKGALPTDHLLAGARAEDVLPAELLRLFNETRARLDVP
jgi:16S rRNA A1518/A1519 N6-dimethyltransferase RsmA/KsgA/DIM1 with predicted DNA glycosylase/AP lyase activity